MKIFNTLTKKKEKFIPIEKNKISMYVCGQTTYDYCHLGHARKEIVFDTMRRWFIFSGYQVVFVENITDIDDKIIIKASEAKLGIEEFTSKYIRFMHEDFDKLGIMKPDFEPKATSFIKEMIEIISDLINKGYAYKSSNGDIYYSVNKYPGYGKLSGKNIDDLISGERVVINENKKNPLDFVLWKSYKDNEPYWNSPFGKGRPGWHIECSAMAKSILGKTFDIHGGGQDLQFPHHENEIAQSEVNNQCTFANYWVHNGFLKLEDEKMSKSLGNFYTLRDVLGNYDGEVVRYFMLKTHYRSPLNFKFSLLDEAKSELSKFYLIAKNYENEVFSNDTPVNEYVERFKYAMDDDFNTPLAISILFELINQINITNDKSLVKSFLSLCNAISLLNKNPTKFLHNTNTITDKEVESLLEKRNEAKADKNYELADSIRKQLSEKGIILEDNKNGTDWRVI